MGVLVNSLRSQLNERISCVTFSIARYTSRRVRVKKLLVFICTGLVFVLTPNAIGASKITPGSPCKKNDRQVIYKNKIYTCIKLGKKFYWDNGSAYALSPKPTASAIVSATPAPAQSISPKPTTLPTQSPSMYVPLLRSSDFTFVSGKLRVVWSGLNTFQQSVTNVKKVNVWVFDLQESLAGSVWRLSGFIAPNPGSFCEISLPPRDHALKISVSYLDGGESDWSNTFRVKANPVVSTPPTDVVAGWG
jgi:hypothetical protein